MICEPIFLEPFLLLGSFAKDAWAAHNKYRKRHDAPVMRMDPVMNQQAAGFAKKLAETGRFEHSKPGERPNQGENLAMWCGQDLSAQKAVEMW